MDGRAITDKTSDAYKVISTLFIRDGIYTDGQYVAIALSSFYGDVGDKFRITLSSGQVFYGIMTDTKKDIHVDKNYAHITDGSVIEFVVDTRTLDPEILRLGSLDKIYRGSIESIERLESEY